LFPALQKPNSFSDAQVPSPIATSHPLHMCSFCLEYWSNLPNSLWPITWMKSHFISS
jgi:hypothetical protein